MARRHIRLADHRPPGNARHRSVPGTDLMRLFHWDEHACAFVPEIGEERQFRHHRNVHLRPRVCLNRHYGTSARFILVEKNSLSYPGVIVASDEYDLEMWEQAEDSSAGCPGGNLLIHRHGLT
jgi:hypothetical protein